MKKKNCENCKILYDPYLRECPICGHINPTHPLLNKHNKMLFTDSTKELLLFLTGLISLFLFTFLFKTGFSKLKIDKNLNTSLITSLSYLFSVGIILCVLSYDNKKYWFSYKNNRFILMGIVIFTFMLFFSSIENEIINVTGVLKGVNENEAEIRTLVKAQPVLMFFTTVIFAPLLEELTYRAGLFTMIYKHNKYVAYIVSVLVFALMHINFAATDLPTELINLPSYIILGLVLTVGYEKEGIAASTFAHSINNLISLVFTLTMI